MLERSRTWIASDLCTLLDRAGSGTTVADTDDRMDHTHTFDFDATSRGLMDLGQKDSTISKVIRYAALASVLLTPLPAKAQVVENRTAHIVEWDLPMVADASPGAMLVDTKGQDKDRLWFVTRLGTPRVFRMNPWKSPMKGSAQWTSWDLAEDSFTTGGLKRIKASHDRRYIFVRTAASLQRVDIQSCDSASCARTEWFDQLNSMNVSDVAVDDQYRVFTTGADNPENPGTSYVQMLTPGPYPGNNGTGNVTLTRWAVGGGAGFCAELPGRTTTSFPCVSGISVHPTNGNLVYYSEPAGRKFPGCQNRGHERRRPP